MSKSDTFYVGANGAGRVKSFPMVLDEERVITCDLRAYLGNKGATASSVMVTTEDESVVSLHTAAISGGVATVEIHADAEGSATVKLAVALANSEVLVRKFYVKVTDPRYSADTAYQ